MDIVSFNQENMNNAKANYVAMPVLDVDKWNKAYFLALANAVIFVFLTILIYLFEPASLVVILSAPVLFFAGSMLSFLLLIQSGGAIAAITWFVLGAGVFFGLGPVGGGLHVHPWTATIHSADTLYLVHINLLNASSVFIVLASAYPFINMRNLNTQLADMAQVDIKQVLRRFFPFVILIAAVGISLKYIMFPWPENLLLRSLTGKIYLLIPSCFLLFGLLWQSLGWKLMLFGAVLFLLEMSNGFIGFTKHQILASILAVIIGMLLTRRSIKFVASALMIFAFVLFLINPLITMGRAHVAYDAGTNSITTRLAILGDVVRYQTGAAEFPYASPTNYGSYSATELAAVTADKNARGERYNSIIGRLKEILLRFDIAPIQGYLLNEYDNGRPGKSLEGFWAVLIPRIFWPGKPIITRFGPELHKQYYKDPSQVTSSLAPTYSAEAYWNYGPLGVVMVSVLLGLGFGWLTRCSQYAVAGLDPAYFLIAFPVAIWASFVESWVVATYLGEFIIFVVLLLATRSALALWYLLHDKIFSKSVT